VLRGWSFACQLFFSMTQNDLVKVMVSIVSTTSLTTVAPCFLNKSHSQHWLFSKIVISIKCNNCFFMAKSKVARLALLGPNLRNLVPTFLTLFKVRFIPLQKLDLATLGPIWDTTFFTSLTNGLQVLIKFLSMLRIFDYKTLLGALVLSSVE